MKRAWVGASSDLECDIALSHVQSRTQTLERSTAAIVTDNNTWGDGHSGVRKERDRGAVHV